MSQRSQAAPKRVLVVGLGRQGWAIVRQLRKLLGEGSGCEIYVYDVVPEREEALFQQIALESPEAPQDGWATLHKSRAIAPDLQTATLTIQPDLILNASTFTGHEFYTHLAFQTKSDYIDLGQSTWQAMKQRALDHMIQERGVPIRIIPACGLAPGLTNIFGAWLLEHGGDSMQIRVGGLPLDTHKGGDLHYGLSWSLTGLLQEYMDATIARKEGRLVSIIGLKSQTDREEPPHQRPGIAPFPIRNPELARYLSRHMEESFLRHVDGHWQIHNLEARPTSDGISLMPFDPAFAHLTNLEYKTLRYYGHFDCVERITDGGSSQAIESLEHATPDLVLLRVWTEREGRPQAMVEGLVLCDEELDRPDQPEEETSLRPIFTAMQHLTGWPTVLTAKALLDSRGTPDAPRPALFRQDHTLWSGRSLETALQQGGVIMPYELIDGQQMLTALDSDGLIPLREFHLSLP